ncbi:MAG TPA: hypothetical protein VH595_24450 [Verrucomicrobiae bacterium]|jgi:hypothetical protein|nr:hypothetical protein [Verrucomicrobiae bacterium]
MSDSVQTRLKQIRDALLALHKALIDAERVSYEQAIGRIKSPNHFLELLMHDPWFAWLQPMSQLIVAMDEALEEKDAPLSDSAVEGMANQTRLLLRVSEEGEGASKQYFDALQGDPGVVLAHAEVAKLLKPPSKKS